MDDAEYAPHRPPPRLAPVRQRPRHRPRAAPPHDAQPATPASILHQPCAPSGTPGIRVPLPDRALPRRRTTASVLRRDADRPSPPWRPAAQTVGRGARGPHALPCRGSSPLRPFTRSGGRRRFLTPDRAAGRSSAGRELGTRLRLRLSDEFYCLAGPLPPSRRAATRTFRRSKTAWGCRAALTARWRRRNALQVPERARASAAAIPIACRRVECRAAASSDMAERFAPPGVSALDTCRRARAQAASSASAVTVTGLLAGVRRTCRACDPARPRTRATLLLRSRACCAHEGDQFLDDMHVME